MTSGGSGLRVGGFRVQRFRCGFEAKSLVLTGFRLLGLLRAYGTLNPQP